LRSLARRRLAPDDDVLELRDVRQPPQRQDGELEDLVGGDRRRTELPAGDLDVLVLDRVLDVEHRQAIRLELRRVEPDAHAVRPGAQDLHLADTGQARQRALQVDQRVVAEEGLVEAVVPGIEAADQQDVGAHLLHADALRLDFLRQLRERAVDRVLHQRDRGVEVGADVEGERERVAAVAAARRLHGDRILDAVDRLLERNADGGRDHFGAGARSALAPG